MEMTKQQSKLMAGLMDRWDVLEDISGDLFEKMYPHVFGIKEKPEEGAQVLYDENLVKIRSVIRVIITTLNEIQGLGRPPKEKISNSEILDAF